MIQELSDLLGALMAKYGWTEEVQRLSEILDQLVYEEQLKNFLENFE